MESRAEALEPMTQDHEEPEEAEETGYRIAEAVLELITIAGLFALLLAMFFLAGALQDGGWW